MKTAFNFLLLSPLQLPPARGEVLGLHFTPIPPQTYNFTTPRLKLACLPPPVFLRVGRLGDCRERGI